MQRNQEYNALLSANQNRANKPSPSDFDNDTGSFQFDMSLPISERRSAERLKRLQRNTEYNALLSNMTSKPDDAATTANAASASACAADGVMSLPIAERRSAEKRKRQQRNDEYNQLVIAAERRRASDNILDDYLSAAVADDSRDTAALSLPISERLSAQQRKELERNREYNEYLQSRGLATTGLSSATVSAADFPRLLDRLDERLERRKTRMRTASRSRSVDSRLSRRRQQRSRPRSDDDARPAEV